MNIKDIARDAWKVLKNTFRLYHRQDTTTLSAALSFYTIFSLAPVVIIVIAMVGVIFGPQAVEGEISAQIQSLIGAKSADLLQELIRVAYRPGRNVPAAIIAVVLVFVGAVAVFGQLRTSLNTIWEVKHHKEKTVLRFFLTRIFSFAMVITLAFLLLISLVIHAGLEGFSQYLQYQWPDISVVLFKQLDAVFSLCLTWLLFTLIYKYMSDAKLVWHSAWRGALFTAVLFEVGKYYIGMYLGKSGMADAYGAAGAVMAILIWVFYSSQILFFGAEFTRALAEHRREKLTGGPSRPAA